MAENPNTPQTRQVEALMAQVEHVRTHQPVVWDEHAPYAEDAADLDRYLRRMLADAAEALDEHRTADPEDMPARIEWLAEVAAELTEALAEYDPMTIPAQLEAEPPAHMNLSGPWSPSPERVEAERLMRALARDGLIRLVPVVSGGSDDAEPEQPQRFTRFGITQMSIPTAPLRASCYGCGGYGCSACNHSVDCEPGMCAADCPTRLEEEGDPTEPCPACSFVGEHSDRECRENQQAQSDADQPQRGDENDRNEPRPQRRFVGPTERYDAEMAERLTLDPGAANEMPDPDEDAERMAAEIGGREMIGRAMSIARQPAYEMAEVSVTLPSMRHAAVSVHGGERFGSPAPARVNWSALGSVEVEDARAYAAAILAACDEADRMNGEPEPEPEPEPVYVFVLADPQEASGAPMVFGSLAQAMRATSYGPERWTAHEDGEATDNPWWETDDGEFGLTISRANLRP